MLSFISSLNCALLVYFLLATFSVCTNENSQSMNFCQDLQSGASRILAIGKLNQSFLLLFVRLEQEYFVYDLPLSEWQPDTYQLNLKQQQPIRLAQKWPTLAKWLIPQSRALLLHDHTLGGEYLLANNPGATTSSSIGLNIKSGQVGLLPPGIRIPWLPDLTLISSTDELSYYTLQAGRFTGYKFVGATSIREISGTGQAQWSYTICSVEDALSQRLPSAFKTACKNPVQWRPEPSFSDGSRFYLISRTAVLTFAKPALVAGRQERVTLRELPLEEFFLCAASHAAHEKATHVNQSSEVDSFTNSTEAKVAPLSGHQFSLWMWIVVGVSLLLLFLAIIILYCHCCRQKRRIQQQSSSSGSIPRTHHTSHTSNNQHPQHHSIIRSIAQQQQKLKQQQGATAVESKAKKASSLLKKSHGSKKEARVASAKNPSIHTQIHGVLGASSASTSAASSAAALTANTKIASAGGKGPMPHFRHASSQLNWVLLGSSKAKATASKRQQQQKMSKKK